MTVAVIFEFEGATLHQYFRVNGTLGIDAHTGAGDWPDGLLTHSAGINESGDLVVMEVWSAPEQQASFMEERLGEALAQGGLTAPPPRVTWIELSSHHILGG